jgi:hypothetical protein
VAKRRQRRGREKHFRHAPKPVGPCPPNDGRARERGDLLVYSRGEAARLLGISLATLDRRVVPAIATVKTEWGARLILATELERYLAERQELPRSRRTRAAPAGRKPSLPSDVIARIRLQHAQGASLAEIARRLNRDDIPTGQGGRQWWPSTVRAVLLRSATTPFRSGSSRRGA